MTPTTSTPVAAQSLSWRIPAIDGIRALAMLMVFLCHAWEFAGKPMLILSIGTHRIDLLYLLQTFPSGVDLFMVLSGFCLFLPLCKEEGLKKWKIRDYFTRRIRRIAPPYYAAIVFTICLPQILVLIFHVFGLEANRQPIPSAFQILTHVFFIHTFFVETWQGINGSFWSLGLEAQFYLAFPLAIWGYRRYGFKAIWVLAAISILYRILVGIFFREPTPNGGGFDARYFLITIFFIGRWMQFAAGMAAAWIVASYMKSGRRITAMQGTALILTAIVLYPIAISRFVTQIHLFPFRDILLAVCCAFLIVGLCASESKWRVFFENRVITFLGFISYSIFLIHQPLMWYFSQLLIKRSNISQLGQLLILCTIGFVITLAFSYIFFLVAERPFLNTRKTVPAPQSTSTSDTPGERNQEQTTVKSPLMIQDQSVP